MKQDLTLAQSRYSELTSDREQFLDIAREAASLTLPYLLTEEGLSNGGPLATPWQSVGAKGVNVLSAKLMLSLFPINTTFFKLQINDAELAKTEGITPDVRTALDQSLAQTENIVMQEIAETTDRVQLHAAMKHLITCGNSLLYAGKKGMKVYPLDRYVVSRDGNGDVVEIVTREYVDRGLLPKEFQAQKEKDSNAVGEDGPKNGVGTGAQKGKGSDAEVYTYVKAADGQHKWHQECDGKIIPGSQSVSPIKSTPWMPLRFNVVDGESYGRGRVEEFIGDLKSLESLMRAMVEGSAAMAKVVFLVSPSATTKAQSLARATNGAIIQGRPDDVGVVQANKSADFQSVQQMITTLTARLSDAFLILNVRDSERTTASEVQATQQELNEQLGGIYGNLTVELLQPYLNRKLAILSRAKKLPPMPKGLVTPTVVAGVYGIGRGQDKAALLEFITTLGQVMGPESLGYINQDEFIRRLAASSGIQMLGLVKTEEQRQQEARQAQEQQQQEILLGQAGQLAKSPMAEQAMGGQQQPPNQG